MDNEQLAEQLVSALQDIHAELKRINQTLAAQQQARPSVAPSRPSGPPRSGGYGDRKPSFGGGRPSPGRPPARSGPGRPPAGEFRRPEADTEDGEDTGFKGKKPFRFSKEKSASRHKGKLPAKKGSGYPKKRP